MMGVKGSDSDLVRAVLDGRERWYGQRLAAQRSAPDATWVELGLNLPGWPKRPAWALPVFEEGLTQSTKALGARLICRDSNDAGWFALFLVEDSPEQAKRAAVDLEQGHRWGRLWDLDVRGPEGAVSRAALGLPERACLACGQPHWRCIGEGAHALEVLREAAREVGERQPHRTEGPR